MFGKLVGIIIAAQSKIAKPYMWSLTATQSIIACLVLYHAFTIELHGYADVYCGIKQFNSTNSTVIV